MRKLCPNYDREDGLDTVLEVPVPEEMFSNKHNNRSWQNMKSWMKPTGEKSQQAMTTVFGSRNAEIQLLLGVVGAPLIPLPIRCDNQPMNSNIKDNPIVSTTYFKLFYIKILHVTKIKLSQHATFVSYLSSYSYEYFHSFYTSLTHEWKIH
jgi:hypothetical protein